MQLKGSASELPIELEEFYELMNTVDLGTADIISVAVSGGGDSMALAYLLKHWCDNNNKSLVALSVDHGLRSASGKEAEQVGCWMAELDVEHHTLLWQGDKPTSNIQDEARAARYKLLGNWCVENQVRDLFVAHHQDDQAETFLMRLFRGSGIDGLSAMDVRAPLPFGGNDGVTLHRPLLDIPKSRLIKYLKSIDKTWIEDPSNAQDKYTRIKVRELIASASIDGLNTERMAATASRMKRVKSLLDELTVEAESRFLSFDPLGYAVLDRQFCHEVHEEIALRLLSKCLKKVGGQQYGSRLSKLENLFDNLNAQDFPGQTLSGAMLFGNDEDKIVICREASVISDKIYITKPKQYMWDNRFVVDVGNRQGKILRLNGECISELKRSIPDFNERLCEHFGNAALRDRIVPSLPCIVTNEGNVVLWDHLLSILNHTDLDGFSADFKE